TTPLKFWGIGNSQPQESRLTPRQTLGLRYTYDAYKEYACNLAEKMRARRVEIFENYFHQDFAFILRYERSKKKLTSTVDLAQKLEGSSKFFDKSLIAGHMQHSSEDIRIDVDRCLGRLINFFCEITAAIYEKHEFAMKGFLLCASVLHPEAHSK
uniref:Uncharacterized protein n=1 Tax=Romanomermis culicivorax TaxID=13658 RepID=A0A915IV69_ROMCU